MSCRVGISAEREGGRGGERERSGSKSGGGGGGEREKGAEGVGGERVVEGRERSGGE